MKNIKTFKKFYESLDEGDDKWNEIRNISTEWGIPLPESSNQFNFSKTLWGQFMKFILFGNFEYNANFIYPDTKSREFKEQSGHLAKAEDLIEFYHTFFTKLKDLNFLDRWKKLNVDSFEEAINEIYKEIGKNKLASIANRLAGSGQTTFDVKWILIGEKELTEQNKKYLKSQGFEIFSERSNT